MSNAFSSQAGLASFTPIIYPRVIYAAVIEWEGYDDSAPDLILARSERERLEKIIGAVRTEYQSREDSGQDWPEAFAILDAAESADSFPAWYEQAWGLQDLSGGPTIATYEQEV
jgi:hypothetical protein